MIHREAKHLKLKAILTVASNIFTKFGGKSAFSNISVSKENQPSLNPDDSFSQRTAFMDAAVKFDYSDINAFTILKNTYETNMEAIQNNGAQDIRRAAQRQKQLEEINAILQASKDNPDAKNLLLEDAVNPKVDPNESIALEEQYVNTLFDMAQLDSELQDFLSANDREGASADVFDYIRNVNTNGLIFRNSIDKLKEEKKERPWGWAAFEVILLQSIPIRTAAKRSGVLHKANLGDNILPGESIREDSRLLNWAAKNLPPEEFQKVSDDVAARLKKRMTDLGYEDKTLELMALEELIDAPPAIVSNIFNAIDNIPLLAIGGKAAKDGFKFVKGLGRVKKGSLTIDALQSIKGTEFAVKDIKKGVSKGVRGTSTLIPTLDRAGGSGLVADAVASTLLASKKMSPRKAAESILGSSFLGDVYGSILPTGFNPWGRTTTVSTAGRVGWRVAVAEQAKDLLLENKGPLRRTERLNPSEREKAINSATRKAKELAGRDIHDIDVSEITLSDGSVVREVTATVGTKKGTGFVNLKVAERYAKERGLTLNPDEPFIQDNNGKWFVNIVSPVDETGFFHSKLEMKAQGSLGRFLSSADYISDEELLGSGLQAGAKQQRAIKEINQSYGKMLRGMDKLDKNALEEIWQLGNNESRWFNREEFDVLYESVTGSSQSDKAWHAYEQTQLFNDIDWVVRNDNIFKKLQTEGYETATINAQFLKDTTENVRRLDKIPDNVEILDVSTGNKWKAGELTELNPDYMIVKLRGDAVKLSNGEYGRVLIGKKADFGMRALERYQLSYREGGHRLVKAKYFVKQAWRAATKDGGDVLLSPKTHIGAMTIAEAKVWANTMESIRLLVKDTIKEIGVDGLASNVEFGIALRKITEGAQSVVPTADEIIEGVKSGKFNWKDPYEVVKDGDAPSAYAKRTDSVELTYNPDELADENWANSHGYRYTGKKGKEVLKDYQGEAVPTFNMQEMMDRSLTNLSKIIGFGDYNAEAINRWNQTYRKYLNVSSGTSALESFRNGKPLEQNIPSLKRDMIINSMEAQRRVIRDTMRLENEFTRWTKNTTHKLAAFVNGDNPSGWRNSLSKEILNWSSSLDPISMMKGIGFDLKLGMFAISQLPLQITTSLAAVTLSPKFGSQGMMNLFALRPALQMKKESLDVFLDTITKNGVHKLVGFDDADEYKAYIKMIRSDGFLDIGNSYSMINDETAFKGSTSAGSQLREASRFFFYEAEKWNRGVAAHIAWKETRQNFPNLDINSSEFNKKIMTLTNRYSLSMARESDSAWQRGLTSIPTQFFAYQARMHQAMFGKVFTPAQRVRLVLGQGLMWGGMGVPALGLASFITGKANQAVFTQSKGSLGVEPNLEAPQLWTLGGLYERGFVDHAINYITGMDVVVGKRVAAGALAENIVRDLFSMGEYGDTSPADFLLGASFGIWGDVLKDSGSVLSAILAEGGEGKWSNIGSALNNLARNSSGYSNAWKAYMVHKYNIYYSTSGQAIADDIPSPEAFAALMSWAPGETEDISQAFTVKKFYEPIIKDATNFLIDYRGKIAKAGMDNDQEKIIELISMMNHVKKSYPAWVMREAKRKAGDRGAESVARGMEKQMFDMRMDRQASEIAQEVLESQKDE